MTTKSIQQRPKYCVPTFYSLEKHKNLKFTRGMNDFVVNCKKDNLFVTLLPFPKSAFDAYHIVLIWLIPVLL